MLTDPVTNEYQIPVRTNVHTHILGSYSPEVPINTDPSKSTGDADVARLFQLYNINDRRLFVIEAKQNGEYLNASFTKNEDNYTIINDDIIFDEICNNIY